ncbi:MULTISPECIES: hypothetical protein [unclassified Streptomyces]|uniref:hypothetical protein n=1 Tax=unclassified Streptomyces TaxID=2593676 RepID=UPI00341688F9
MPRGRHRHSPPLHRVLPSSAIAGVSLVCAIGPWLFTDAFALRVLAAGAAATAVVSAVVLRQWDTAAGKRVADLTRARASDEWRHEERVAELETDLEESRELRAKLEQKLRAKRTELAGLRNEHAALLRRYATAETERATALEGRRQLAIEASVPARALPAARTAPDDTETPDSSDAPGSLGASDAHDTPDTHDTAASEASSAAVDSPETPDADATAEADETPGDTDASESQERPSASEETSEETADAAETAEPAGSDGAAPAPGSGADAIEAFIAPDDDPVSPDAEDDEDAKAEAGAEGSSEAFSPTGSSLFLRPGAAQGRTAADAQRAEGARTAVASTSVALALPDTDPDAGPATTGSLTDVPAPAGSALDAAVRRDAAKKRAAMQKGSAATKDLVARKDLMAERDAAAQRRTAQQSAPAAETGPSADSVTEAGGAQGKPEAAREHQRAAAEAEPSAPAAPETSRRAVTASPTRAALPPARPAQRSGHFTVPTAVAVVPQTAPVRRPSVEGGFDFFGTQKEEADAAAMEAVQNEDLADVVGQEALAAHKAESEAGAEPVGEPAEGADRQVIDLTEHDETEHIDMTGLRSAAS